MNEKSLKLLEQYDIEVSTARRGRGSYICETPLGKKLLSDYTGSENKMIFVNKVLEVMKENGYAFPDQVMANKEGKLVTYDRDENGYVLKDWYEGRECDAKSMPDIELAVMNLAKIHQMMVWKNENRQEGLCMEESLLEVWKRHNRELHKTYEFIRRRKQKNSFEKLFLQCFSEFEEQAREACCRLEKWDYGGYIQANLQSGRFSHGNYNHHNIYFVGKKQIFTANFEKCSFEPQVTDLYQFLRKMMEKRDWSRQEGSRLLELYNQEKPLESADLEYLKIRLFYPEKFWKLANQYYNCRKSCLSCKNAEKLERLTEQQKKRMEFLEMFRTM